MLETALLSSLPSRAARGPLLTISLAAHAAILAALLVGQALRDEDPPDPPMPVVFIEPHGAPSPAGSPTGSQASRSVRAESRRLFPPDPVPARIPDALPAADSSLQAEFPDTSRRLRRRGRGRDAARRRAGTPGGTGEIPGAAGLGSSEDPIPIGGDVRAPVLVHRVEPDYPEMARKARLEGTSILQAVIGTNGEVENLKVLAPSHSALDASALDAVSRWRYRPATLNGRLVRVYLTVTVRFRLR